MEEILPLLPFLMDTQREICHRYYYCDKDTKRGEKSCPVGKAGSAAIEDAVKEQAQMIFNSPYFLERVSVKTNLTIPEIKNFFSNEFWKETNPGELNHLYKELFEKIILKEDQIVYEVKTSGVQALIEGVTNECE